MYKRSYNDVLKLSVFKQEAAFSSEIVRLIFGLLCKEFVNASLVLSDVSRSSVLHDSCTEVYKYYFNTIRSLQTPYSKVFYTRTCAPALLRR